LTRIYVTGTDTGVGKTLVTSALAAGLRERHGHASIVKIAQTGVAPGEPGDAEEAARLSSCVWFELARFLKPADPWTAALAEGAVPLRAADAVARIASIEGSIVVEGSGGAAVPLNERESISEVAASCALEAVVVVGLRLGCLSHTILTLDYLRARAIAVRGLVCSEMVPVEPSYVDDVRRVLSAFADRICTIGFEGDEKRRYRNAVDAIAPLL